MAIIGNIPHFQTNPYKSDQNQVEQNLLRLRFLPLNFHPHPPASLRSFKLGFEPQKLPFKHLEKSLLHPKLLVLLGLWGQDPCRFHSSRFWSNLSFFKAVMLPISAPRTWFCWSWRSCFGLHEKLPGSLGATKCHQECVFFLTSIGSVELGIPPNCTPTAHLSAALRLGQNLWCHDFIGIPLANWVDSIDEKCACETEMTCWFLQKMQYACLIKSDSNGGKYEV